MPSPKLQQAIEDLESEELPMDMSSMIDLVFLLLIFFMVSSRLITLEIDKDVKVPIAKNSIVPENTRGRIVVNIHADGTVWGQGKRELVSFDAIKDYVREKKEAMVIDPTLLLRADKDVETRDIKKAVQASAEVGVVNVVFGSLENLPPSAPAP